MQLYRVNIISSVWWKGRIHIRYTKNLTSRINNITLKEQFKAEFG